VGPFDNQNGMAVNLDRSKIGVSSLARRSADWVGWMSGLGGLAIAGSLAYAYVHFQPPSRDDHSLCLKSASSASAVVETGHHLLIIDKTDKWNDPQAIRLRNIIAGMRDQLGLNERFSIFVFENKVEQGFPPVFSLCNPGRGTDTTFLTSNPRRWEKRFNDSFGKPLDDVIGQLIEPAQGSLSPILEILIDITNREELNRGDISRSIVLVSDMLQNSDAYTFFPKTIQIVVPTPTPAPTPTSPFPFSSGGALKPAAPPTVKYRTPPVRKLSPSEAEVMVERKGGLPNLKTFKPITVYQIRGKYPEEKLQMARQFWDLISTLYGARIDWKIL
jgi:hypothetical protein